MKELLAVAMEPPVGWVAASARESDWAAEIWIWGGVLIVLAGVSLILMLRARRRLFKPDDASPQGWTLQDIRQLHASGQLTDEEYANLRQQILGATGAGPVRQARADTKDTRGPGEAAGPEK